MPHLIYKHRFLEVGKPAPKGSRFKGIISQESIIGWSRYTGRASAKVDRSIGDKLYCRRDGYLGYTSNRIGATGGTYSYLGWLDSQKRRQLTRDLYKATNHKGAILYDEVIALDSYEYADKVKMYNASDYANVCAKIIPEFFKELGLDSDNVVWWEDHHTNTTHPHIHLCFIEKDQQRTRGKFTQKQLDRFQFYFAKEMGLRYTPEGKDSKTYLKDKDKALSNLIYQVTNDKLCTNCNAEKLLQLYQKLPVSGRLQYGSTAMIPFRDDLDSLTMQLLSSSPLRQDYQNFLDKLDVIEQQTKSVTGKAGNIRKNEMQKLMKQCGNAILQKFKDDEFIRDLINHEKMPEGMSSTEMSVINKIDLLDSYIESDLNQDVTVEVTPVEKKTSFIWSCFNDNYTTAKKLMYGTTDMVKDLNKAQKLLLFEADRGNPLAMSDLAYLIKNDVILNETGLSADAWYNRSLQIFKKLCSDPKADYCLYRVGKFYQYALGVDKDAAIAFNYFKKSADYKYSQMALGSLYQYGDGVEQSFDKAYEWYLQSARQGNPMAAYKAAELIHLGKILDKDTNMQHLYGIAYNDFTTKSLKGEADQNTEYILGKLNEKALGTKKNVIDAYDHYIKAATLGHAISAYKAAELIRQKEIYQPIETAQGLYKQALKGLKKDYIENKNGTVAYMLATIYYYGRCGEADYKAAEKYALAAKSVSAKLMLSKIYLKTDRISDSVKMLMECAELGNDYALYKIGCYYMRGTYLQKNEALGLEYLSRSAKLGNFYAQKYLDRINSKENDKKIIKKLYSRVGSQVGHYLAKRSAELDREIEKYLYGETMKE